MLVAEVIVDLRAWALDRPLTYALPSRLHEGARVGSVVRVPVRGRRLRGWIVEIRDVEEPPSGTLDVAGLSGRGPVFDEALLGVARLLARRGVQPLASFLRLFTPPRLGRPVAPPTRATDPSPRAAPAPALWRPAPGDDPLERYAELIGESMSRGLGSIIVVPEVREGSRILEGLRAMFPEEAALVHSGQSPAARSKALWSVAMGERRLALGGRAAVFVPPFPLGTIIVHAEHDPSLTEQRAPHYDAREVALARADAAGSSLLFVSPTPSLAIMHRAAAGWSLMEAARSAEREAWPAVEVLRPAPASMPRRAVAAILETHRRSQRSLILLTRAGPSRGGPGPEEVVRYVSRVVPAARIARADRPGLGPPGRLEEALQADVVVATEAALAEVERPPISTAVVLGLDGILMRPSGRAVEDAFASLWALGCLVGGGGGGRGGRASRGRLLLETRFPEHHLVQALTRGDYHYFASRELRGRSESGSPPFRTLIRLRTVGPAEGLMEGLRALPGTAVLGPVPADAGLEVLLKVETLELVLDPLRAIVSANAHPVSVDVDPREW